MYGDYLKLICCLSARRMLRKTFHRDNCSYLLQTIMRRLEDVLCRGKLLYAVSLSREPSVASLYMKITPVYILHNLSCCFCLF